MATRPDRVILTYDDYVKIPSDRNRYELFEGDLVVTPSPGRAHQTVVKNLLYLLEGHVRRHGLGTVWVAPFDVLFNDRTVVQPDLLYVARDRLAIVLPRYVQGAPDLVVEVLSPSTATNDREAKRELYARYGVTHYWLFDPERREAEAFQLTEGRYRPVVLARESEQLAAPPFPDFALPLDEVWE